MIQITPQMRILVAIEAVDGRKGIDSLARLCQEKLQADPFSGCLFVFRSRRGTSIRILVYDGQGFWLAQKRLVAGEVRVVAEWKRARPAARSPPGTVAVGGGQPGDCGRPGVAQSELKTPQQNPYVLVLSLACCSYGGHVALPRTRDRQRAACLPAGVHSSAPHQQPLEAVPAIMRSPGVEAGQRGPARHGLPRSAADAGAGRRDPVAAGTPPDPRSVPNGAPPATGTADRHQPARDAAARTRPVGDRTGAAHRITNVSSTA